MNQLKRQLDISESSNEKTKMFRSVTSIENLSNELFYEIFDYLDGSDICKAFDNLNSRLQNLITLSSYPLKIKLHSKSPSDVEYCCKKVVIPNKHHIVSLDLKNELSIDDIFMFCIIDSSFCRLESIVLDDIPSDGLTKLFFHLKSLPRLYALTMNIRATQNPTPSDIYQLIFSLPHLKYNQLGILSYEKVNLFLPPVNNEQFSPIEYLVINHSCNLDDLISMLCSTPRLRHLTCHLLERSNNIFKIEQSMTLSNLKSIRIEECYVNFNVLQIFIRKISSPLRVLSIGECIDKDYFDADRWEGFIIEHIPFLRRLHIKFPEQIGHHSRDIHLDTKRNRFTSSFWNKRQWFWEFVIYDNGIGYSIHSHRTTWSDIYQHKEISEYFDRNIRQDLTQYVTTDTQQDTINSTQFIPNIQLSVKYQPIGWRNRAPIGNFESIFRTVLLTRLNICCKEIRIDRFLRIIHLLPNLDLLKVSYSPVIRSDRSIDQDVKLRSLSSNKNKITKVYFEKMIDIEQVHFLFKLCVNMKYFQVNVPEYMNLETLVQFILSKISTHVRNLNSLCLYIPNANENMVLKLHKMIDSEKLLTNYMIKRIYNNILLKWN